MRAAIGGVPVRFAGFYRGFSPKESLFVSVAMKSGFTLMSEAENAGGGDALWICGPYTGMRSRVTGALNALGMYAHLPWARDRRWSNHGRSIPSTAGAIFETAENVRVPPRNWRLSLSFDTDDYDGTNHYTPYWMFATDLFSPSNPRFGAPVSIQKLKDPRPDIARPPRFCAAIFRNPDPLRLRAIEALARLGTVDVYGPPPGLPLATKNSLLGKYRYILAFENSLFPGYVTEKLVEAWACGSIPLWYGLLPQSHPFNRAAFVNLQSEGSISALIETVRRLESEDQAWERVAAQPLLLSVPNISPLLSSASSLLFSLGAQGPRGPQTWAS